MDLKQARLPFRQELQELKTECRRLGGLAIDLS